MTARSRYFHRAPVSADQGTRRRLISGCLFLGVSLTLSTSVAFASASSAQDQVANRIECSNATDDFALLCLAFDMLVDNFVDGVVVADLAEAARQGVVDADLANRITDPPACALPAPAFEAMCAEIDRVVDTRAAALAATDAMLASLNEPRTRRLTPAQQQSFDDTLNSSPTRIGIGIEHALLDTDGNPCTTPGETCRMVVSEVYSSSPAESAGLLVGDVIVEYGKVIADHRCENLRSLDYGHEQGQTVWVSIVRDGMAFDYRMRTTVVRDPVAYSEVVDGNIGYIQLDKFARMSNEEFSKHLSNLLNAGVNAIVVDLRNNPGGYLDETSSTASEFLTDGDLIYRVASVHFNEPGTASGDGAASDAVAFPMAVAVNGLSGSGSELFALAMRGNNRAKIVGTATYGKTTGQVSQAVRSSDGTLLGAVQVTSLRFWGPGDTSAGGGIQPDTVTSISDCAHPIGVVRRVIPSLHPRVSAVAITSVPAGAAYVSGDTVTVSVTFDAPITVDPADGTPFLELQVGNEQRPATYESTSTTGTTSVVDFEYTIGDDKDPDGISIEQDSINLNGATIRHSGAFWDAVLDHPGTAGDARHAVSTVPDPITADPAPADLYFSDISQTPFVENINWLAEQQITRGCGPDTFCPHSPVTRGQTAALLSRALQLDAADQDYFTDDDDSTFQDHINRLRQAGITRGCGPDTFCPHSPVTRGQMAALLSRALQLDAADQDYFTDDDDSTFQDHINRLRQAGITRGCGPDTFCPHSPVTRGQMAALLHRARDLIPAARRQAP